MSGEQALLFVASRKMIGLALQSWTALWFVRSKLLETERLINKGWLNKLVFFSLLPAQPAPGLFFFSFSFPLILSFVVCAVIASPCNANCRASHAVETRCVCVDHRQILFHASFMMLLSSMTMT